MAKRHVFQSIGCSAALLLLTSISAADDTGIKDGSFQSGTSGVWKQTSYTNQSYAFETEVRDETCGEVPRQAYLHLELDLPCSSCFIRYSESPELWQDDIQLGACDIGEHAILRFDHRILSSVSFVALDVTIEARSKDQNEVVSASRSLLSIGEDSREDFSNCAWSTDEVTLDISALSALEASTFKIIFKLRPWGVCGGPERQLALARMSVDIERAQGAPHSQRGQERLQTNAPRRRLGTPSKQSAHLKAPTDGRAFAPTRLERDERRGYVAEG
ncbi:MAG: hypothetical protein CBC32_000290, partial [Proteobacteria bacterium TMED72]